MAAVGARSVSQFAFCFPFSMADGAAKFAEAERLAHRSHHHPTMLHQAFGGY
jgi:hypothetical protein